MQVLLQMAQSVMEDAVKACPQDTQELVQHMNELDYACDCLSTTNSTSRSPSLIITSSCNHLSPRSSSQHSVLSPQSSKCSTGGGAGSAADPLRSQPPPQPLPPVPLHPQGALQPVLSDSQWQ